VTVTPELKLAVSPQIKVQFENGRDYYALDGHEIRLPLAPYPPPSREFLEWHGDMRFKSG
jgi:putative restriction endonuclease